MCIGFIQDIPNKRIRSLIDKMIRSDKWYRENGKKHIKMRFKDTRQLVVISKTPSDEVRFFKEVLKTIKNVDSTFALTH